MMIEYGQKKYSHDIQKAKGIAKTKKTVKCIKVYTIKFTN